MKNDEIKAEDGQPDKMEEFETAAQNSDNESIEDIRQQLKQKEEELKTLRDEAARARADYYNLRTRVERDHERDMNFAAERAITGLLPIYENLERITASISDKEDSLSKGISMVEQQFIQILQKLGLEEIRTNGKFDPALHEAIMTEPVAEEDKDGDITGVFRKGYKLAGRVLQAAQVKVGKKED